MLAEESSMKETRFRYDNLMSFKGRDVMKLMEIWGIPHLPSPKMLKSCDCGAELKA